MLTSQDHSLYEIMMGSRTVGVKGQEDLSEAAEMYRTVFPLSTEKLRKNAAVDKEFPHEHVFKAMLRDVALRRADANGAEEEKGLLTSLDNPDQCTAQALAINLYTAPAYRTMAPGQKYGARIGKWQMKRLRGSKEGSYQGSDKDKQFSDKLYDEIFDVLQVAARISYEGLTEAGSKAPEGSEKGEAEFHKLATTAYKGQVYRGEGLSIFSKKYNKAGSIITLPAMTSTARFRGKAELFRDAVKKSKLKKPVLVTMQLTGKSGVDISELSRYHDEAEVLIPAGTQLKVVKPLTGDDDGNYEATLEEVSGSDSYLKSVAGVGTGLLAVEEYSGITTELLRTAIVEKYKRCGRVIAEYELI